MLLVTALCVKAEGRKNDDAGIKWLDSNFARLDKLQKRIHAYAEPGYQEVKSSKALADELEAEGFSIEWGVGGIPTAFVATYGSGSPVIGLLGEYDALPKMSQDTSAFRHPVEEGAAGHACGHNLLGTATAASAISISKWLAQGHEGTVKYFGCPAEEGGGGKAYMTAAGCFNGCDAIFDWHPGTRNSVSLNTGLANVRVNFTFTGTSAHASAAPWNGRSALDGVESFNYMMNMMREHIPTSCRIHYIISNGGQSPNVVPEKAQVIYYLRHPKGEVVLDLLERAIKAAEGAAMGTGTTMSYELINGSYEKLINSHLSDIFLKNMKKVGGIVLDDREKEFCMEVIKNSGAQADLSNFMAMPERVTPPSDGGGSSDVGNVSQVAPLASISVATSVSPAGIHTWQQCAIGGTTVGTKALINVAKIFYLSALDLYNSPQTVQAIWDEYHEKRGYDFQFKPLMGDRLPPFDYCK